MGALLLSGGCTNTPLHNFLSQQGGFMAHDADGCA